MVSVNITQKTKLRFKKARLNLSASKGDNVSEDDFVNILLSKYEGKRK